MIRLDMEVVRKWRREVAGKGIPVPTGIAEGKVGVSARDIKELRDNLVIFAEHITSSGAKLMANIAIDLLSRSQPKVPWDTGQLRESGKASLIYGGRYSVIVGRGTKEGNVKADLSKVKRRVPKNTKFLSANVTYYRVGEDGKDVALWTHEELLPYEARPAKPAARKPGTGPKYLESTFHENKSTYIDWINDQFSTDQISREIKKKLKVIRKGKDKFEVDIVKLVR